MLIMSVFFGRYRLSGLLRPLSVLALPGLSGFLLFAATGAAAQTTPVQIAVNPERSAGIYHSYEFQPCAPAPAPEGFVPFYISHYGRHGSRYHTSEKAYTGPLETLRCLDKAGALTPKGREALSKAEALDKDARLRYGDLSKRGVKEHRAIAGRMFASYGEVFSPDDGREVLVESRSTLVPRVILSMAAFNERLKELNPAIRITRESSQRYMDYLAGSYDMDSNRKAIYKSSDSLLRLRLQAGRFVRSLARDAGCVDDALQFMQQMYLLAGIAQDVDELGISLYDLFTDDELYALWEAENAKRYLLMGPSARFGEPIVASAAPLLRNIVETAQRVIDGKQNLAASLRFGHDVYIVPLLALLGAEGASARVEELGDVASAWSVEKVSPMAANIQFIFLRNPSTGEVRVRVLHNECDAELPLAGGPYYPWPELKAYLERVMR